jgi:hypothetical protein
MMEELELNPNPPRLKEQLRKRREGTLMAMQVMRVCGTSQVAKRCSPLCATRARGAKRRAAFSHATYFAD